MAITKTTRLQLSKADVGTLDWATFLDANTDRLDACLALGDLACTLAETPSASLNVVVAAGSWLNQDGSVGTLASPATVAIPASTATRYLWAVGSSVVQGSAWPGTTATRIAVVTSGSSTITAIVDARLGQFASGAATSIYTAGTGLTLTGSDFSISASYVGQTSITTLGTVTTGTWSGTTIAATSGGTGQSSYALGDTLYSSATNVVSKLAGNTTTSKKFLNQTGTGSVSAAPAWSALDASDVTTGTIGTARLGSGTASSSTFLRGDSTWQTVGGSGTVTSASVVSANGFAGSVATATTTPAITLTTSITGVLKGNGTAISAAAAGTDYLSPSGSGAALTALTATNISSGTVPTARLGSGTASSSTFLRGDQTWTADGSTLTTLNASNLASGTVGTARLGSGTASSTTFLRGDQTWQTPSSGAGGLYADVATVVALPACTYSNGSSGVGATLTANANGGLGSVDGQSISLGNILLIKNQVAGLQHGLYSLTQLGTAGVPWIFTRSTGLDTDVEFGGNVIPVLTGSINAGSVWLIPTKSPTVGSTFIDVLSLNLVNDGVTGTRIGTAVTQKLGFWGVATVVQPASANQAAIGTLTTIANTDTVDQSTGINANFAAIKTLLNQLRSDLVAAGLIKGSA